MSRSKSFVLSLVGIAILAVFMFPIYWMIVASFKTTGEIFVTPPTLFPAEIYVEGYTEQLSAGRGRSFVNSLIVSLSSMAIVVALAIPAAYGLARYPVPGKKSIILFFLVTQMLPVTVVLTPLKLRLVELARSAHSGDYDDRDSFLCTDPENLLY